MNRNQAEALADASAFFIDRRPALSTMHVGVLILFLAALSQPRWGLEAGRVSRTPDLIWFAFDVDRSMACRDLPGGRLEFAKGIARRLMESRGGAYRVSTFGQDESLVVPATRDRPRTERRMESLTVEMRDFGGVGVELEVPEEGFAGIVFTSGREISTNAKGSWIIVGLGDPNEGAAIPNGSGGWIEERGEVAFSRRNDDALRAAAEKLEARLLTAWPDADEVADRLNAAIQANETTMESATTVPKERYQWFLAAGLLMMLKPWQWLRFRTAAAAALALLCTSTIDAQPSDRYSAAREHLAAGRWKEATKKFDDPLRGGREALLTSWVFANGYVLEARETADRSRRTALLGAAVRAYRTVLEEIQEPELKNDLRWNIAVAKSMLAEAKSLERPTERSDPKVSKDDSQSKADGNQSVAASAEKKAGTDKGGGGVEQPVAGLTTKDPGVLSRAEAERIIEQAARFETFRPAK
jgi:hypothetical protein